MTKLYSYVGPADVQTRVAGQPGGTPIDSVASFLAWVRETEQRPDRGGAITVTFVIDAVGRLLVADRHSEHVACASGGPVLSAGEMVFRDDSGEFEVDEVSNQSTGYCPEPESWSVVADTLDRIGLSHPGRFTTEVVFRRCERCRERNVVRDRFFVCGLCGADLPESWNF